MTYLAVEALILTRIQGMSQFSSSNSARGKWGILNSGRDNQYAVLRPGARRRERITTLTMQDTYQTIVELWQRYKDDGTSMTDLEALVDAVTAEIDKYRRGGDATGKVQIMRIPEVREFLQIGPPDGPDWLRADVVVETVEENDITYTQ